MVSKPLGSDTIRGARSPTKVQGAVAGGLTVIGFSVVHDIWITDIWFNMGPMAVAGALCGLCLVWSYNRAVPDPSARTWWAYHGVIAGLLIAIGGVSLAVLDPKFTMAEVMVMDDALAQFIPPALPLMIVASVLGTVVLWAGFGRHPRAILPMLVTHTLLVFLVGHNLAILGLVEMTSGLLPVVWKFVALTAFLASAHAAGVMLLVRGFGSRRT